MSTAGRGRSDRRLPLADLQPSQLYVSAAKLRAVLATPPDGDVAGLGPLPVRRYGDRLVLTDGHTRARRGVPHHRQPRRREHHHGQALGPQRRHGRPVLPLHRRGDHPAVL